MAAYRRKNAEQKGEDTDPEVQFIEVLGERSQLYTLAKSYWTKMAPNMRQRLVTTVVCGEWASMEQSVVLMSRDSSELHVRTGTRPTPSETSTGTCLLW